MTVLILWTCIALNLGAFAFHQQCRRAVARARMADSVLLGAIADVIAGIADDEHRPAFDEMADQLRGASVRAAILAGKHDRAIRAHIRMMRETDK